jgi:hypothetical protein
MRVDQAFTVRRPPPEVFAYMMVELPPFGGRGVGLKSTARGCPFRPSPFV